MKIPQNWLIALCFLFVSAPVLSEEWKLEKKVVIRLEESEIPIRVAVSSNMRRVAIVVRKGSSRYLITYDGQRGKKYD